MRPPTFLLVFFFASMPTLGAFAADRFQLPQGPGRELVYGHCQTCHDLQSVVDSAGIRRGAWDAVLGNMKGFGLRISEEQRARILDYLGTYLGPNPPAEPGATEKVAGVGTDGRAVFNDTCIACHQEDGKGKQGEFPPLAGNKDLFLSEEFPILVVLNGIEGPLIVAGQSFDNAMPAFDFLSDEQIAAVIRYVRSSWGNEKLHPAGLAEASPENVKKAREKPMTSGEVLALRQSLSH